ncbi:hypothetical protein PanWU01x14_063700 [Parasponia andersonii]|uniref:Tyrosine-protein kinase n=1 Tax=Parasponia andersonii TaxID=3476 RepID=A0A2P5DH40_PARAD|nr:hypothetical protein PanWU01x14_063700 [Parasponia andersonii]
MLEVATGMRPDLAVVLKGRSTCFAEWASLMVVQNREREILEPNSWACAPRRGLEKTNIKKCFRVAFTCADASARKRPPMRDVVELLTRNFT